MSILLEALRKSEKNQRPHETPTIHSEVQSGSSADSLRIIPLAVLLIAVLSLTGWFVWSQYRAPEGSYEPPVTLSADKVHKVPGLVVAGQGDVGKTAKPPAPGGTAQKRTPVESYQPPAQSEQASAVAETPSTTNRRSGVSFPGNQQAAAAAQTLSSAPGGAGATFRDDKPDAGNNAGVDEKPKSDAKAVVVEEKFNPGEPEPIGYWELPDSVRADVPVIKFSVLVYAANPADRFVLINGQRLGEGDSVKPGLVVKEIRRDGAVFSYRLYQFLVER